jgi:hypothetical protein
MRTIFKDCTVLQCAPVSISGSVGSPVSVLATAEDVEIMLKRVFVETTATFDDGESSRATRWGTGSVKISNIADTTKATLAGVFAASSHTLLQFTEAGTGESYQLYCKCEDLAKSMGKGANKDTITLGVEGVPLYAPPGGTLAIMNLDVA